MTMNALTLRDPQAKSFDVEAQQHTATKKTNINITRAKLVAMATVCAAGGLATALLSSAASAEPGTISGRTLSNSGCSENQLRTIKNSERALIISGSTAGASLGGMLVGLCIFGGGALLDDLKSGSVPGCALGGVGGAIMVASSLGFTFGLPATVISGIVYGVQKGQC